MLAGHSWTVAFFQSCIRCTVFALVITSALVINVTFTQPASAHGEGPDESTGPIAAPRSEARSGPLELVAVYNVPLHTVAAYNREAAKDTLALFVSRYADGAPVKGAQVEAGTDLDSVTLTETDPGVYISRDLMISAGRNDLNFTVTVPGQPARTQKMWLTVPGGALMALKSTVPTPGRTSPAVIGGAVLAVYVTMMMAFLVFGGFARLPRIRLSRPLRWVPRPIWRGATATVAVDSAS
jgi:hypothetical protein